MLKDIISIIIVFGILYPEKIYAKNSIGFWQLLSMGMEKSHGLIQKQHDIDIKKQDIEIARKNLYPTIYLQYTNEYYHSLNKDNSTSVSIDGSSYSTYSEYRNAVDLGFNYILYDFDVTKQQIDIAKLEQELLESEKSIDETSFSKELLSYYKDILIYQNRIDTNVQIQVIRQNIIDSMKRLNISGSLPKIEILSQEIKYSVSQQQIIVDTLQRVDILEKINLLSSLSIDLNLYKFEMFKPKTFDSLFFEETKIAKKIKKDIDRVSLTMDMERRSSLPTLNLKGGYKVYGSDPNSSNTAIENLNSNNWNIQFYTKWTIFDGYETSNKIKKLQKEKAKLVTLYAQEENKFIIKKRSFLLQKEHFKNILNEENILLQKLDEQHEALGRLNKVGEVEVLEIYKQNIEILDQKKKIKEELINKNYKYILDEINNI